MATYRLFPSTSGPASANSYTGSFISSVVFSISGNGNWFEGYWWWVAASGQSTAAVKCALWSVSQTSHGGSGNVVVPGSVITSGTLTAGQWNYIPLSTPIQLAAGYVSGMSGGSTYGGCYCAAIGCNGNFPDTNNYWGSAITNGPLFAYSGTSGSLPAPYSMPQGCFTTAGSDPSTTMPNGSSGTDNFWVDVQVSDTAPTGYAGSYRLWPNKFDTNGQTSGDSAVAYVVATEVDLSQAATLNYVHYFVPNSASSSAGFATQADLWNISSGTSIASITSPTWLTETGGTPTIGAHGQWVKAAFPVNTVISPGKYRISVYNANGASGSWASKDATSQYWSAGVGQNGLTWGPITAPDQASAQSATYYPGSGTGSTGGQPVFAYSGSDDFPSYTTGTNPAQNYWVDLEATPAILSSSGLLLASII